jgi:SAM-dependent methyltransferase
VQHIDAGAIDAVTRLYRAVLPAGGAILDLMSSWVSHLPNDVAYSRVVGLGMNESELRANTRLQASIVQNLNHEPHLPFDDASFDGAICTVSVQYLQRPVEVFREVGRVLKANAPFAVTFSNRCFPTKAVAIWLRLDDTGHLQLVQRYFAASALFGPAESVAPRRGGWFGDPLYGVVARRLRAGALAEDQG